MPRGKKKVVESSITETVLTWYMSAPLPEIEQAQSTIRVIYNIRKKQSQSLSAKIAAGRARVAKAVEVPVTEKGKKSKATAAAAAAEFGGKAVVD